jgi:thymidine kinase
LAIDEAHFWDERLKDFIQKYENDMLIISTALQFNYRGEPFMLRDPSDIQIDSKYISVADLMGISTDLHQKWPLCTKKNECGEMCERDAFYPQRRNEDGELSKYSDKTIVIGAKDSYAPRCREHYIRPKKE